MRTAIVYTSTALLISRYTRVNTANHYVGRVYAPPKAVLLNVDVAKTRDLRAVSRGRAELFGRAMKTLSHCYARTTGCLLPSDSLRYFIRLAISTRRYRSRHVDRGFTGSVGNLEYSIRQHAYHPAPGGRDRKLRRLEIV